MKILIVGGGRIGESLIRTLEREDVYLVEKDGKRCDVLAEKYNISVIEHDALDVHLWEEIKPSEFDKIFITTGRTEVNVFIALMMKKFGGKDIICRVNEVEFREMLSELGIKAISEDEVLAREFLALAFNPGFSAFLRGLAVLQIIEIPGKEIAGEPFFEIIKSSKYYPLFVIRNGKVLIPEPTMVIDANDRVIVVERK